MGISMQVSSVPRSAVRRLSADYADLAESHSSQSIGLQVCDFGDSWCRMRKVVANLLYHE